MSDHPFDDAIARHYARQLGDDQPRPAVNKDPDWREKWGLAQTKRANLPPRPPAKPCRPRTRRARPGRPR
jgi:hypothetical protein